MISVLWDSQCVIMVDYLEEGRAINGAYYVEKLRWLRQEIVKKRRGKLNRGVLFLQDHTPSQISQAAMATATKCSFQVLSHPSYSPNLAPSDFHRFQIWKLTFVVGILEAMKALEMLLMSTWEDQEDGFYFEGITLLEQRWRKCIEAKGDYIEK